MLNGNAGSLKCVTLTPQVIEDFAADGVSYLELRTTPKSRPEHDMTKTSYLQAVLLGISNFYQQLQQQQQPDQQQQQQKQQEEGQQQDQQQQDWAGSKHPIIVKLLLSIDRREGAAAALQTVSLREG